MSIINVNNLHAQHPQLRAKDWRSPLARRLLQSDTYADGSECLLISHRSAMNEVTSGSDEYQWSGLGDDFAQTVRTYQAPVITEYATLAIACATLNAYAGQEITEVTRRGEKADYYIGDREYLLEASGQQSGNLAFLCQEKSEQLLENPFGKNGYVCVANFSTREARLWFYPVTADGNNSHE